MRGMKPRDLTDLVLLGALWGASFLFMRIAAPVFGPVALISVRVGSAALLLLPILMWRGELGLVRQKWQAIAWVGVINSTLPFVLFAYSTLTLTAGMAAILNATAPMWTALIAWLWLGDRLPLARVAGLVVGLGGVAVLVSDRVGLRGDGLAVLLAIAAGLGATLCYGVGANLARRSLAGVPALVTAGGSLIAATVVLLPFALWFWPATPPAAGDWAAAIALGLLCTALAYLLFFRLIARVGATGAVSVTFLIPLFAVVWGVLFLDEGLSINMAIGGGIVLAGTALSTGILRWPARRPPRIGT